MNTICSFIPSCWEAGSAFSRTRHGERSSSWNRGHSARESLRSATSLLRRYSRRPASEAIGPRLACTQASLRQITKQRQQISQRGRNIVHRYALVKPVAEPVSVLYEKRADPVTGYVFVAKPHAVARTR